MVDKVQEVFHPPILFQGLDPDSAEYSFDGFRSPSLSNVMFTKNGMMRSRKGMRWLGTTAATSQPVDINDADTIHFVGGLTGATAGLLSSEAAAIFVLKGNVVSSTGGTTKTNIGATWRPRTAPWNSNVENISTAWGAFTLESTGPSSPSGWSFVKGAAYCVSNDAEPCIATDRMTYLTGYDTDLSSSVVDIDNASGNVFITVTPALAIHGDLVSFDLSQHAASAFNTALHRKSFHLVSKNSTATDTEFYLKSWSGTAYANVTVAPATTAITTNFTMYYTARWASNSGFQRWPRGVYDATNGVRGYPKSWDDVDGAGDWTDWEFPRGTPDWPGGIEIIGDVLESRAYAWGFKKDPQRIDYSELGAPYNFLRTNVLQAESGTIDSPGVDGGYFYAGRGDGDPVVAVRQFQDYLAVFKFRKILLYKGQPGDLDDPLHIVKTIPVGCVCENSVVAVGNDLYFWSQDGPRSLIAVNEYGDLMTSGISARIRSLLVDLDDTYFSKIVGRHNKKEAFIAWHLPYSGTTNNKAIVYQYEIDEWTVFDGLASHVSSQVTITPPWSHEEFTIAAITDTIVCDNGNFKMLFRLDSGEYDSEANGVDGYAPTAISASYKTRWFDGGDFPMIKYLQGADVVSGGLGFAGTIKYNYDFYNYEKAVAVLEDRRVLSSARGVRRIEAGALVQVFQWLIEYSGTAGFQVATIIPRLIMQGDRA